LISQGGDGDVLGLVCLHKLTEVETVGLIVGCRVDELVVDIGRDVKRATVGRRASLGIMLVGLHPLGRAPRRGPKGEIGVFGLSHADRGNDGGQVAVDVEVLHVEVALELVATVPVAGIVACPDGNASHRESEVAVGIEQAFGEQCTLGFRQQIVRIPREFIETRAPTFKSLTGISCADNHLRSADHVVGNIDGLHFPVVAVGRPEAHGL